MPLGAWANRGAILNIWGPALLAVIGLASIYSAYIRCTIARVVIGNAEIEVRLKPLDKQRNIPLLIQFLEQSGLNVTSTLPSTEP